MKYEKSENYYDKVYSNSPEYRKKPHESIYFELWQKALSLIKKDDNILEIGCGAGHFASILQEKYKDINYYGVDFSLQAVLLAQKQSTLTFHIGDVYDKKLYDRSFNTIVALEVLEHIRDIEVLGLIKRGTKIIATLPDFDDPAHLIYFKSIQSVTDRYSKHIKINSIHKHKRWYILNGVKI